jgi:epoxyqueuosine reductase
VDEVKQILESFAFTSHGFVSVEPTSFEYYRQWIEQGLHGDMDYLERHAELKADPRRHVPGARSAVVVTKSYVPHPHPREFPLPIASYARGLDYHDWMMEELKKLKNELQRRFPKEKFLAFVDSAPVLERDFAARAGLGWIGKNGCLINRERGSFEFIGGILTSLDLEPSPALAVDHCGTCTRCQDACPTGAIVANKKIDATKCISYLTIEAKTAPPPDLALKIDSYFGCDICQNVCPWNRAQLPRSNVFSRRDQVEELRFILTASGRSVLRHFNGTPLTRATPLRHRKNALLLAARQGFSELAPEIRGYVNHPFLGGLARLALERLEGRAPRPFQEENSTPPPPESAASLESKPPPRPPTDQESARPR